MKIVPRFLPPLITSAGEASSTPSVPSSDGADRDMDWARGPGEGSDSRFEGMGMADAFMNELNDVAPCACVGGDAERERVARAVAAVCKDVALEFQQVRVSHPASSTADKAQVHSPRSDSRVPRIAQAPLRLPSRR